jgi:predicted hotdog family 3-hydroxylacyl-ACP dehydratase
MRVLTPHECLPHGRGMQLLGERREFCDGSIGYQVRLTPEMSVVEVSETAAPELGLEMMAQASGMLIGHQGSAESFARRVGAVAAVRDYSYEAVPFRVGERIEVRVKAESLDGDIVICEGLLFRGESHVPAQRARITLIVTEGEVL